MTYFLDWLKMTTLAALFTITLGTCAFWTLKPGFAHEGSGPHSHKNPNFESAVPEENIPLPGDIAVQEFTLPDGTLVQRLLSPQRMKEDQPLIRCSKNVLYKEAWVLALYMHPDGTVTVDIDTNGDNRKDVEAVFRPDNDIATYPDRYIVDLNYDGEPDRAYVDPGHTGDCDNIVPEDTMQHDEEPAIPNYDSPRKGEI